jgi:hypothetical protein
MNRTRWLSIALLGFSLLTAGCGQGGPGSGAQASNSKPGKEEEEIRANLAKLSPEDRAVAEAQRYCAVSTDSRLGGMGVPYKVMVKDQPVFLCCSHCEKTALADPDKTLSTVKGLKEKYKDGKQ